jgi:5-amino-6-(5-phosphoribosylamino)uracil reductase
MTDKIDRPYATVILAISADGKIADAVRSPARFGSAKDKAHLEQQVAASDAVLFGNGTLQAYGTTMRVISPELVKQRELQGKPPQPVQIVCSRSSQFDPNLRFFQQPVPRWLLTGQDADTAVPYPYRAKDAETAVPFPYRAKDAETAVPFPYPMKDEETAVPFPYAMTNSKFDRIIYAKTAGGEIDWIDAFQQLANFDIKRLAILGGGKLVASVLAAGLVDELWLTVCPLILGGADAPTPVEGKGFLADLAPKLELLAVKQVGQEVFLHYKVDRSI